MGKLKYPKAIAKILERYNGSVFTYETNKPSKKSIKAICASGSKLAPGMTVEKLIDNIRKK